MVLETNIAYLSPSTFVKLNLTIESNANSVKVARGHLTARRLPFLNRIFGMLALTDFCKFW